MNCLSERPQQSVTFSNLLSSEVGMIYNKKRINEFYQLIMKSRQCFVEEFSFGRGKSLPICSKELISNSTAALNQNSLPVFAVISFRFKRRLWQFSRWSHVKTKIHWSMWQRHISRTSFPCHRVSWITTYDNNDIFCLNKLNPQ